MARCCSIQPRIAVSARPSTSMTNTSDSSTPPRRAITSDRSLNVAAARISISLVCASDRIPPASCWVARSLGRTPDIFKALAMASALPVARPGASTAIRVSPARRCQQHHLIIRTAQVLPARPEQRRYGLHLITVEQSQRAIRRKPALRAPLEHLMGTEPAQRHPRPVRPPQSPFRLHLHHPAHPALVPQVHHLRKPAHNPSRVRRPHSQHQLSPSCARDGGLRGRVARFRRSVRPRHTQERGLARSMGRVRGCAVVRRRGFHNLVVRPPAYHRAVGRGVHLMVDITEECSLSSGVPSN